MSNDMCYIVYIVYVIITYCEHWPIVWSRALNEDVAGCGIPDF